MIRQNSIENLRNHLDIVDVIGNYLPLKKAGANFKTNCPFHGEKTPSFVISPTKQIFHCFGCGIGGDSIKFVMEYEKLSYPEAIEKLASTYNIQLEYDNNYKKLDLTILENINQFYQKLLIKNETAYQYLIDRGVSSVSIEKFELGFSPDSNYTINYINSQDLDINLAKEYGVVDFDDNGRVYSRFIQRIMFPIYAQNSKIVGFGGRTISGHNAKYINSPQTVLFNKSKLLYGYNIASSNIYKKKQIIVTEGYLDVIMLHQAGFDESVATLGTALTKEHIPLLRRGEPKVVIAYDGDNAGINAALKVSYMLSNEDIDGGVVIFGDGLDPADMVKDNKIEELDKIFSHPVSFIQFVIDTTIKQYNINIPQEKQKVFNEIQVFLKTLKPILQNEYKIYIAQKLNIDPNLIFVPRQRIDFLNPNPNLNLNIDMAELSIIKTILENQKLLDMVIDILDIEMFETHRIEFEELISNNLDNPNLRAISINDDIKVYSDEELKQQLLIFLQKYYEKKKNMIKLDSSLDFDTKIYLLNKYQDTILKIKQGNLSSLLGD
jgi:DNA primase